MGMHGQPLQSGHGLSGEDTHRLGERGMGMDGLRELLQRQAMAHDRRTLADRSGGAFDQHMHADEFILSWRRQTHTRY